jgi:uncharacterized OB-fold protein
MSKPKKEKDLRFAKFGTVSFTATTKVNDFIDYLDKGEVRGTKCKECGAVFFPPRADCYKCLSSDMEWFQVTGTGKLITFSRLMYAPIGFGDDLPYAIALVEYGDYKVFGRIGNIPLDEVEIGMDLTVRVNNLPNGQINYVFDRA